jgi:hypothetical protein
VGKVPPVPFHRREAARFARLAERSSEPSLKQKLGRISALHERVALEIEMIGGASSVGKGGAQKVGEGRPESYRIHFLHGRRSIATHDFEAESDIVALAVAYSLQDACSDFSDHFELWQGSRVIARSADLRGPKRLPHLQEIVAQMQADVLQMEELLLASRQSIAESRKLLLATERLRSKLSIGIGR